MYINGVNFQGENMRRNKPFFKKYNLYSIINTRYLISIRTLIFFKNFNINEIVKQYFKQTYFTFCGKHDITRRAIMEQE